MSRIIALLVVIIALFVQALIASGSLAQDNGKPREGAHTFTETFKVVSLDDPIIATDTYVSCTALSTERTICVTSVVVPRKARRSTRR